MKRRMRHVLPTAPSPTRQILTFIRWRSIDILTGGSSRPPALGYKGIAQRLSSRITGRVFAGDWVRDQASARCPIASASALNASLTPAPVFADARKVVALWMVPILA